ncbi:AAA family ATPase, partial [Campylobacter rectus]|uniref:ATP-binding protein n=1 Tax=Campylobacter rectus TaxID=203 RepID=UPI0028EC091C
MYIKRAISDEIKEYMKSFPVLLISGARQVGKSTLALNLDIPNYITLDDINIYESARNDPKDFIEHCNKPIVIDEIQRVPILLLAIKEFVDKDRTNGQFILTVSANLKGFKDISDSLAGRIGIVELYPLSQKELSHSDENLIDILSGDISHLALKKYDNDGLSEKIINGGYPEIMKISSEKSKYLWFSSYIRTYIESD